MALDDGDDVDEYDGDYLHNNNDDDHYKHFYYYCPGLSSWTKYLKEWKQQGITCFEKKNTQTNSKPHPFLRRATQTNCDQNVCDDDENAL